MAQDEVNGPSCWLRTVLITPLYVRVTLRYCKGSDLVQDRIVGSKFPWRAEVESMLECFRLRILVGKQTVWCFGGYDWRVCGKTCSSMVQVEKVHVLSCKTPL